MPASVPLAYTFTSIDGRSVSADMFKANSVEYLESGFGLESAIKNIFKNR